MKLRIVILSAALGGCSPGDSDEVALIRGAEALGWSGRYDVAGHSFRELPASYGGWQIAPAGNLTALVPRRAFEALADLPDGARARRPIGDVMINIGAASAPDIGWRALQPLEPAGEYGGLKRFASKAPGVVRPGDTLILPAPYQGRIDCPADALPAGPTSCNVVLHSRGLRHSFTITAAQVGTWQSYVDGYLRVVDYVES